MKTLKEMITNDSLGTEYDTKEVFSEGLLEDVLGKKVKLVGIVGVFEGSNEVLMELKLWTKGFNISDYEKEGNEESDFHFGGSSGY
jgi:hypothetical protein